MTTHKYLVYRWRRTQSKLNWTPILYETPMDKFSANKVECAMIVGISSTRKHRVGTHETSFNQRSCQNWVIALDARRQRDNSIRKYQFVYSRLYCKSNLLSAIRRPLLFYIVTVSYTPNCGSPQTFATTRIYIIIRMVFIFAAFTVSVNWLCIKLGGPIIRFYWVIRGVRALIICKIRTYNNVCLML